MSQEPSPAEDDEFPPSFEEMRSQLGDGRRDILTALVAAENHTANTSELRKQAGIPSGSMSHHMDLLERWAVVKEIDRTYAGRGAQAIVWQLTERGEEFCEDGLDISSASLVRPDDLDALQEDVEDLRGEVEIIKEAMVKIAVKDAIR
jgi:predicted ArsR family transcriptional regulator